MGYFMLPESRLLSFIDQESGILLKFFEGQKLLHDLVLIHDLKGTGLEYFRDCILSTIPIITFLKPGETLGLYIDSDEPYFRLKIEMNEAGLMRTLLLPENFNKFPEKLNGKARLSKTLPSRPTHPYTSIIDLSHLSFKDVINKILKDSYQVSTQVFLSDQSDQSIMIEKLPPKQVNKLDIEEISISEYWVKKQVGFNEILSRGLTDIENIKQLFERDGLLYLSSKKVKFQCNCSKERMIEGLKALSLGEGGLDNIFQGQLSLETRCDYCNTFYEILKSEI